MYGTALASVLNAFIFFVELQFHTYVHVVDFALKNSIKRRLAGDRTGGRRLAFAERTVLHFNFCTAASTRFEWMDGSMNLTLAE